MMQSPAVAFRDVSKVYPNGTVAVERVSFEIEPGKIVALLGPSGCGKTTTLRLINRLEEPTSGEVHVRGINVAEQRPEQLRRSIGYVIQEGGLFPHMTVAANVATVPRLLHWPAARIRDRVREVLDLVGLPEEKFGSRMPHELSGGQRQRVGVARGLAADPDILLMDEPFGALDPGTRATIQDEFLRLQERLQKTVVMVTHDIAEAGKMADDILLMVAGHLAQEGRLRDLLLQPASDSVRAFLGKQGSAIALEALRIRDVIDDIPQNESSDTTVELSIRATYGEALVALVDAAPGLAVVLYETPARRLDASALRRRILADLHHGGLPAERAS